MLPVETLHAFRSLMLQQKSLLLFHISEIQIIYIEITYAHLQEMATLRTMIGKCLRLISVSLTQKYMHSILDKSFWIIKKKLEQSFHTDLRLNCYFLKNTSACQQSFVHCWQNNYVPLSLGINWLKLCLYFGKKKWIIPTIDLCVWLSSRPL